MSEYHVQFEADGLVVMPRRKVTLISAFALWFGGEPKLSDLILIPFGSKNRAFAFVLPFWADRELISYCNKEYSEQKTIGQPKILLGDKIYSGQYLLSLLHLL